MIGSKDLSFTRTYIKREPVGHQLPGLGNFREGQRSNTQKKLVGKNLEDLWYKWNKKMELSYTMNSSTNSQAVNKSAFKISRRPNVHHARLAPIEGSIEPQRLGLPSSPLDQMMVKWDKNEKKYACYIGPGNADVVIKVLMNRGCWIFRDNMNLTNLQLVWKQTNSGVNFGEYSQQTSGHFKAFNHFEFHSEISQKDSLLRNFTRYCEVNGLDVFAYLPPSFELRLDSRNSAAMKDGVQILFDLLTNHVDKGEDIDLEIQIKRLAESGLGKPFEVKQKLAALFEGTNKIERIPASMNQGQNIWIVKPIDFNRGNGIEMMSNILEYPRIIKNMESNIRKLRNAGSAPRRLLMQKYIEAPLLINNRKFDIRMWVLLDSILNLYVFPEGYLRMSSEEYSLYDTNKFIHLTNNAVQQHAANYQKFEKGNQLSFADFKQILKSQRQYSHIDWEKKIYPQTFKFIKMAFNSVVNKLNPNKRERQFELFGIDFMIDAEGALWLIEVNTNPCLELSSPLLEKLIPRMVDDALALTVDQFFPPPKDRKEIYSVEGYPDDSNMWIRTV